MSGNRILILGLIVAGAIYIATVIATEPAFVSGAFTSTQNGDLR